MIIVFSIIALFFTVAGISDYKTRKAYEKEVKAFWKKNGPVPDWVMDDGKAYVRYLRHLDYPREPKYILK